MEKNNLELELKSWERFSVGPDKDIDGNSIINILYVPRISEFEHYHIDIPFDQVKRLYKILKKFVKDNET